MDNNKMFEDEELTKEIVFPKFTLDPEEHIKSYKDSWNEQIENHKYWNGFIEFAKFNQTKRWTIMSEVYAVAESWESIRYLDIYYGGE